MAEAKRIINEVSLLVESLVQASDMELVDVEFRFENGRWTLRVFIDKKEGVTLDDCAYISRELGDLIETEDIIDYKYVLEISSPGLNRPLKKENDFVRSIGKMVTLKMSRPINTRKNVAGRLTHVREGMITILMEDNTSVELPLGEIEKARLKYEFGK
jgi:ribosome maturation factor RimP